MRFFARLFGKAGWTVKAFDPFSLLCPCGCPTPLESELKAFWNLPLAANSSTMADMVETDQSLRDTTVRQRRLDLAQKAFREFYAQCFWSYREDTEITEDKIAFVIRGLREHGGLAGYQIAAKLCH
jgi:hypothetical protein